MQGTGAKTTARKVSEKERDGEAERLWETAAIDCRMCWLACGFISEGGVEADASVRLFLIQCERLRKLASGYERLGSLSTCRCTEVSASSLQYFIQKKSLEQDKKKQ